MLVRTLTPLSLFEVGVSEGRRLVLDLRLTSLLSSRFGLWKVYEMNMGPVEAAKVKRFRARAIEARTEAAKMSSPENRKSLLDVAVSYEQLANSFEARARGIELPPW